MRDPDHDPSSTQLALPSSAVPRATPSFPSASAVFQAAGDPTRTVYGPAVLGTMRVEDPAALAALAALRAPEVPRPAAVPVPVPRAAPIAGEVGTSAGRQLALVLAIAGSVIAVAAALAIAL